MFYESDDIFFLKVIITLEDGSQIQQNVLELNDLDDQLVEIHEHPIHVVKAESVEEAVDQEEVENQPTDTSASRESPKKKMKHQPFKPKVVKFFTSLFNTQFYLFFNTIERRS